MRGRARRVAARVAAAWRAPGAAGGGAGRGPPGVDDEVGGVRSGQGAQEALYGVARVGEGVRQGVGGLAVRAVLGFEERDPQGAVGRGRGGERDPVQGVDEAVAAQAGLQDGAGGVPDAELVGAEDAVFGAADRVRGVEVEVGGLDPEPVVGKEFGAHHAYLAPEFSACRWAPVEGEFLRGERDGQ